MAISSIASSVRPWHAFLGLAVFLCLLCFVSNDTVQTIFWSPHRNSPDYWPSISGSPPELETWELDTASNYSIRKSDLIAAAAAAAAQNQSAGTTTERFYEFEIGEIETISDGKVIKVISVNHKFPGPLIEALEGDTIRVRVKNTLRDPTSLHFHGLAMNGTNFFDGASGITQCGIPPGRIFEYAFKAEPAGTYWYHSHVGLQFAQGFIGPIVIHHRAELQHSAPEQHVVLLNDLYDENPNDLMDVYSEPWLGGDSEPIPETALAQGKKYPLISVAPEETFIVRIVNAASNAAFNIQLGQPARSFTVLEVDGTTVKPTTVKNLVIFPSQRYSILVSIEEAQWLFTTPQFDFYDGDLKQSHPLRTRSAGLRVLLRTDPQNVTLPLFSTNEDASLQLKRTHLSEPYFESVSAEHPPLPMVEKFLDLSMTRTSEGSVAGAINNEINIFHEQGNILADFLGYSKSTASNHSAKEYADDQQMHRPHYSHNHHHSHHHHHYFNPNSPVIFTQEGSMKPLIVTSDQKVVDFVVRNLDDGFHPLHLHGHKLWIIERGDLMNITKNSTSSYEHPPLKRDTVSIAQNEWVRIRVVLDNPGIWLLHCHIPWHSLSGMRTLVVSLPRSLQNQVYKVPSEWWELCD